MKKCSDCGFEYPDEATRCVTCGTDLVSASASAQQEQKAEDGWLKKHLLFKIRMMVVAMIILFLYVIFRGLWKY